jgi:general secretion pathway protein F
MNRNITILAADSNGEITRVVCDLSEEAATRSSLEASGCFVLEVRARRFTLSSRRVKFDTVVFCRQVLVLLEAGLPVADAIQILASGAQQQNTHVLIQLKSSIDEGHTMSDALRKHPKVFDPVLVGLIEGAEHSGQLKHAFASYAHYASSNETFKRKLTAILAYPAIITTFAVLVIIFLLAFVVPRFSGALANYGQNLSVLAKTLFAVGHFLNSWWLPVLLGIVMIGGALYFSKTFRIALMKPLMGHIPAIKVAHLIDTRRYIQFYRANAMLLSAGVNIITSLNVTKNNVGESSKVKVTNAINLVFEGRSLSDSLQDQSLADPVSLALIRAGERSGKLGEQLHAAAQFQEELLVSKLETLLRVLEPTIILIVGLGVGAVLALLYLPIFEIAGSIK